MKNEKPNSMRFKPKPDADFDDYWEYLRALYPSSPVTRERESVWYDPIENDLYYTINIGFGVLAFRHISDDGGRPFFLQREKLSRAGIVFIGYI